MKKNILLVLTALIYLSLSAVPLTIFYTGDTHGVYQAKPLKESNAFQGGYLVLEETLQRERALAPRSVYLDSGDQQTGTIFASLVENGIHGGAVVEVFNRLGLDASTFGNHEFDFSYTNTRDLAKAARYPMLSANLLDKATRQSVGRAPYTIIERDGLRIGVLGTTLEILPEKVRAENTRSVRILPPKDAIAQYLDEVDAATDLIVVLTHQGLEADSLLAMSLDDRVDLIIGGHDHIAWEQPRKINGIWLLYSGSHLRWLGKASLDVENDRVRSLSNSLLPLISATEVFSTPLSEYISAKLAVIQGEMSKVVGTLTEDWMPDKYVSTAVSRWLASALKEEYQAIYKPDLAIINNGGIRKHLVPGSVTRGDLQEMLPFTNTVVVFSCYGRDLLKLDDLNARHSISQPHDICEVGGLTWDVEILEAGVYESPDPIIQHDSFRVNGAALDPDRVYRVISHDYVAGQWDKYLGFEPFDLYDTGELLLDAALRQFEKQFGPKEDF